MVIDRGFAAPPPACVSTFGAPKRKGDDWGEASANLGNDLKERQICLNQVSAWLDSERKARGGAAGS